MISAFLTSEYLSSHRDIAVALSGGPDSMALLHMLESVVENFSQDTRIHALTVNHSLRPEAAEEARQIGEWIAAYRCTQQHILCWETPETTSRVMEAARHARYALMAEYCAAHNIRALYIAHHMDDQAETFLFRLAKGSGLDGLSGMGETVPYSAHLTFLRPLLNMSKKELLAYCTAHALPFHRDPSNENTEYARPRMRQSRAALEEEGLSAQRLSKTAKRLERARNALNWLTDHVMRTCVSHTNGETLINLRELLEYPVEIHVRVLQRCLSEYAPEKDYAPRMEKIEDIAADLETKGNFRKRTFAHVLFEVMAQDGTLYLSLKKEK